MLARPWRRSAYLPGRWPEGADISVAIVMERREADRRSQVLWGVMLHGSTQSRVTVRNISEAGAMIETAERMATGASIEIEIPGLGIKLAQVAWAQRPRYGIRFTN